VPAHDARSDAAGKDSAARQDAPTGRGRMGALLEACRALTSAQTTHAALALQAAAMRLALLVIMALMAAMMIALAWMLLLGTGLYYLAHVVHPLLSALLGVGLNAVIAYVLVRSARGEFQAIRGYLTLPAVSAEATRRHEGST